MARKKRHTVALGDIANLTNEEWLKWRAHGPDYADPTSPRYIPVTVGSSAVAIVMGDSPFESQLEFYHEKSAIKTPKIARKMNQDLLDAGHYLEEFVAMNFPRFMEVNCNIPAGNIKVINDTTMYQHPDYPFAVVDPDRLVIINKQEGIMEIKTTENLDDINNYWKKGLAPKKYYWQCQYQMETMDYDFCYLVCMWGFTIKDMAAIKIVRDRALGKEMMEKVSEFVELCELGIEPDMQKGEHVDTLSKYLVRFYGPVEPKAPAVELPDNEETQEIMDEAYKLFERKAALTKELDKLSEEEAVICAKVLKYLQDKSNYCTLRLNEEQVISLKLDRPMHRAGFDEEAFKAEYPNEYKEFLVPKFDLTKCKKKYGMETSRYIIPATINADKAPSIDKVLLRDIPLKAV